jgi:hypothetical protein
MQLQRVAGINEPKCGADDSSTLQAAWGYFGEAAHAAASNKEAQPKRRTGHTEYLIERAREEARSRPISADRLKCRLSPFEPGAPGPRRYVLRLRTIRRARVP